MLVKSEIHRMCRTCLSCDSQNILIPLHETITLANGGAIELYRIIENSLNLRVTDDDNCPQLICENCSTFIQHIHEFREKCHKNDMILREQLETWFIPTDDDESHSKDKNCIKIEIKEEFELPVINSLDDLETHLFLDEPHTDSSEGKDIKCEPLNEVGNVVAKSKVNRNGKKFIDSNANHQSSSKLFKCDTCFEIFVDRKLLLRHRREAHINVINPDYYTIIKEGNKTRYICNICKHFCKHKDHLRVHLRTHTGERPYNCEFCSQTFTGKQHAQQHMTSVHKKSGKLINYRCRYCAAVYDVESDLVHHYSDQHPNEDENRNVENLCDLCGKFIKDMKDHYRTHAGIRLYECKICGKRMTTASALSQHRQRHSDVKKHQCDACGKGFKTQYDLTFHRRIHTEEKTHACHLCDKKFLHRQSLKTHLKVHSGQNPNQVYHQRRQEKRAQQRLEMIKSGLLIPKRSKKMAKDMSVSLPGIEQLSNNVQYYNHDDVNRN